MKVASLGSWAATRASFQTMRTVTGAPCLLVSSTHRVYINRASFGRAPGKSGARAYGPQTSTLRITLNFVKKSDSWAPPASTESGTSGMGPRNLLNHPSRRSKHIIVGEPLTSRVTSHVTGMIFLVTTKFFSWSSYVIFATNVNKLQMTFQRTPKISKLHLCPK